MMRKFVLALCLLILTGCSSSVPRELQSGQKTIAVLSFMGARYNSLENTKPSDKSVQQQIDLGRVDVYAGSEGRRWTHDVVDWGIDRYAIDAASKLLAQKYRPVDFAFDPADLDYEGQVAVFVHEKAPAIGETIRRQAGYAAAKDVDAYVVLLPAEQDFTIFNRRSHGIGFIRDFLSFAPGQKNGDGVYMLHALYNVAVFDGHTLELLAVQTAKSETLYQNRFRGNPAVFVDSGYWAESYQQLTDAKRDKIIPQIQQMIDDTLPATLQELDLLP